MNGLRAYKLIDRLQPQLAAAFGAGATGFLPVSGQASLIVEVQPGILINKVMDLALKSSRVQPGKSIVERYYGFLEFHADSPEEVRQAGQAILGGLGVQESERQSPEILSSQIIKKVSPYHAQMINVHRNASLLLPGSNLFTIECEPAAYIMYAANEVEKNVPVTLVDCNEIGAVGRMSVTGTASEVNRAAEAATAALQAL